MRVFNKRAVLSWLTALTMLLAPCCGALAQGTQIQDNIEAVIPLMDLVCAAAMQTGESPTEIVDEAGVVKQSFISAFFTIGQKFGELGITGDMLGDAEGQRRYLSSVISLPLPQLQPIEQGGGIDGYIGIRPMSIGAGKEPGQVQVIGEIYWAAGRYDSLTPEQRDDVEWRDPAVFTLQSDPSARNGMIITGFSTGLDIGIQDAMQEYVNSILVEYENSELGFSLLYPAVFTDELLVEDESGVSATLSDGSATFFARRIVNKDMLGLQAYVLSVAGENDTVRYYEEWGYATVASTTEDGINVFDVYFITEGFIYQAQLAYRKDLVDNYHLYTSYLENSFMPFEVAVG